MKARELAIKTISIWYGYVKIENDGELEEIPLEKATNKQLLNELKYLLYCDTGFEDTTNDERKLKVAIKAMKEGR